MVLLELAKLLRERPYTARGIAERLGITKPTAYARVAALAMRGYVIKMVFVREGLHGPEAKAYSIVEAAGAIAVAA